MPPFLLGELKVALNAFAVAEPQIMSNVFSDRTDVPTLGSIRMYVGR
jgi:hypothetical protein